MHVSRRIKTLTHAVAVLVVFVLQAGQAQAGLVSTDIFFQDAEIVASAQQNVLSMLDTKVVADQLLAQGVDPESVKQRVANLTDAELLELQNNLETLPAGGIDVLAAALIVFFVLLATDIAGLTDIFPFVKKDK
ncbi:MAG: PA2779 family protein [Gammaproteobacteria bacterium]|nr:PA2779 family protein [Gammaproteobacteria bacterium]